MNDTNNISDNTVDEKVKLEYVNPLNPNEVLKVKDNVNIEQPKEEVVEKIEETTVSEPVEETIEITTPKRKNNLVIVLVVLFALAIILGSILLIPKLFNKEKTEEPPVVQTPNEQTKIGISDIISNSTNSIYYNFLTSTYTVNITDVNNSIVFDLNSIDQTKPINKQITFNLNNRDLKITINKTEDNTDNLNALYAIADSIGQYYGHGVNEVGNYLYSSNNNYNFNIDGITTTEVIDPDTGLSNNMIDITINIDTNISTINLESMYLNLEELNNYKDTIVNNTINLKKGDLVLYTNNADIYTIIIGQRNELTDNTYNTITSLIELLYPEEINDFKSKFTSLSTISFDKYKITIDPVLDATMYPEYQSSYKFISIEITKQAATM